MNIEAKNAYLPPTEYVVTTLPVLPVIGNFALIRSEMPYSAEKMNAYCFNPACKCSVFHLHTTEVTEILLDEATLCGLCSCRLCGHELVSLFSIEIKQAFLGKAAP